MSDGKTLSKQHVTFAKCERLSAVRVTGPDGNEVPAQISNGKVLFVAQSAIGRLCDV